MSLRFALFTAFVAALPLSVDAPPDSAARRGQTRLEIAGGAGQYGIVQRGCEGQVLSVDHVRLETMGLAVEHESADGLVLGIRGGRVRHEQGERWIDPGGLSPVSQPAWSLANAYVNPFVALETRSTGIGLGWLHAEEPFRFDEDDALQPEITGHLRLGDTAGPTFTVRYMEDVPLESEGHLSLVFGLPRNERFELELSAGALGPYDGALFGLKGRLWLTPAAAAQLRVSVSGNEQYNVLGGVSARWPAQRGRR